MAKYKRKKYYAVAGVNAYGVYDNYEKVMESSRYIACFKCKKFDSFEDAKDAAEDMYWDMQGKNLDMYSISEIKRINRCYFRKKCED